MNKLFPHPYDRAGLIPAVVHVGVGGFHRAHQAVYLDDLARLGHRSWGEIGVGLHSPAMRDALAPQDWAYTVVERGRAEDTARVVGSMIDYVFAPDDPERVVAVLADARTRMVTLTITGGGYPVDAQGRFQADQPRDTFDYLVAALDRRRTAGLPGLTVLSCDNIPDNGMVTGSCVRETARLNDPALAAWIEENVSFPSSMVDRITPETDDETRRWVAKRFGYDDRWPVITEPFRQWIIEDRFAAGRPPLDLVGVQFVSDAGPHQLMKRRLLNAGHSALGYLGLLSGCDTTSDAMANPLIADYLAALMRQEIAGLLPDVPGVDLQAYQATLLDRFANPRISDQLARLCGRGSTKMPAYLLPSLTEARRQGRPATLLTLAVAGWCRYLQGSDRNGARIDIRDARRDVLQQLAAQAAPDPRPLLRLTAIFGELGDDPDFARRLEAAIRDIDEYGPSAAIADQLATDLLDAA